MCLVKVLVVDDDPIICQILVSCLENRGFTAFSVGSGEAALEVIHENDFQVIVTDLRMCEIDGHELTRRVKNHASGVKVIMMTGCPRNQEREEAHKNGVDAFFQKPFNLEELIAEIVPMAQQVECSCNQTPVQA